MTIAIASYMVTSYIFMNIVSRFGSYDDSDRSAGMHHHHACSACMAACLQYNSPQTDLHAVRHFLHACMVFEESSKMYYKYWQRLCNKNEGLAT